MPVKNCVNIIKDGGNTMVKALTQERGDIFGAVAGPPRPRGIMLKPGTPFTVAKL